MKIIFNLSDIYNENTTGEVNKGIINNYIKNILFNSLNYFYSNYSGFSGIEKDIKMKKVTGNPPIILVCSIIISAILICVFFYFIYKIYSMEIYFLDKLINFTSTSFDEYLKQLEELKKKFKDDINEEDEKYLEEFDMKGDDIDKKNENNIFKEESTNNNKKKSNKKNKQNKIQQQKLKKRKMMSQYFFKLNILFGLKMVIIILFSTIYFIIAIFIIIHMRNNYKKFDTVLEEINNVYFDSFKIFLEFKSQIEIYLNTKDPNKIKDLIDSQIVRPKFGNNLMHITRNNKYSKDSLKLMDTIYNNNACKVLSNNDTASYQLCTNLFSSILTKGREQAIIQMSVIITSCIDEINSLKNNNKNLNELYFRDSNYFGYEMFVGEFLLESFLKTQNIFEVFRVDEKKYMFQKNKIYIIIFGIIYFFFLIFMIYYIYSYKNVINSFFNFIGIMPAKFITDDDYLYKTILKLEQNFY